jgi:hypothetical protein
MTNRYSLNGGRTWSPLKCGARLLFQSVPHGVLDPPDRVLNFASSFLVPAFDLKFGVTGDLAYSFFHRAFGGWRSMSWCGNSSLRC